MEDRPPTWFKATRSKGRFSAAPVTWQGHASLWAFVIAVTAIGIGLSRWLAGHSIVLAALAIPAVLVIALTVFFRFVRSRSDIDEV